MDGAIRDYIPQQGAPSAAMPAFDGAIPGLRSCETALDPLPRRGWAERLDYGNAILRRLCLDDTGGTLPNAGTYDNATLLVAPCPGARTLVISFGGNTNYLMLPQSIVTLPDAHLIALRDPARCFALCGLAGLGPDYMASVASLRRLIAALGATQVYCTGVSAGGYPALRFGLDLGAQGVLAFSPPTTLDVADDGDAPLSRYPQLTALYKHKDKLAIDLDLARAYDDTPCRPGVLLVYSPSHERDAWLARRMCGIEGVEVSAVSPEAGHRVYLWLNSQNRIPYYIERMLGLERSGPGMRTRVHAAPPLRPALVP